MRAVTESGSILFTLLVLLACHREAPTVPQPQAESRPVLRVFLLAGQSNMQGQAVVDLDHETHYNGGRGILTRVLAEDETDLFAHLRGDDGAWVERDDVFVRYRVDEDTVKAGKLSIGFTGYGGKHHFGPELEFGHVVGKHFDEPVLLVKTAWGGKSLFRDFRPPGAAGSEVGEHYVRMLAEYREALAAIPEHWPELAKHRPELTGFVWFQGWNDMVDADAVAEYADNLAALIRDVRDELGEPALPVVVGETGNADHDVFRRAQAEGAIRDRARGAATFVETRQFLRPAEDSPNTTHGHHWFGNAESYLRIGRAFGVAMIELLD